jgi:anti-anti-sigma factor
MPRQNLLGVDFKVDKRSAVLYLKGELIAETRVEPERILRDWLETGVLFVSICCDGLKHIDSAGMSTLLGAAHRYQHAGGEVILAEVESNINSILGAPYPEKYFKIYSSLDEAREYLKGPESELLRKDKAARARKAAADLKKKSAAQKMAGKKKAGKKKKTRTGTTKKTFPSGKKKAGKAAGKVKKKSTGRKVKPAKKAKKTIQSRQRKSPVRKAKKKSLKGRSTAPAKGRRKLKK